MSLCKCAYTMVQCNDTALLIASEFGHIAVVALLLQHDAEVDWQDIVSIIPALR